MFWIYQGLKKVGVCEQWEGVHVVFRVMTFRRTEITFKASEYLVIMSFDYFVPFSFNFPYYTTILP